MDGIHDLGGKQGFGRVKYPSAPHDETWEPLVRALSAFSIKKHIYNMDEFRHAIERMAPRHYLTAPYYERHLTAVATLLVEKDVVAREELEALVPGAFPLGADWTGAIAVPAAIIRDWREGAREERVRCRTCADARVYSRQEWGRGRRLPALPVSGRCRAQHAGANGADV